MTLCIGAIIVLMMSLDDPRSVQPGGGGHLVVHHSEGFGQRGHLRQGVFECSSSPL